LGTTALVSRSQAQLAVFDHKVEIHGFGGYVWSSSQSVVVNQTPGDLDLDSSGWWGVALDINLPVGTQLELLYTRQDTKLTFNSFPEGKRDLNDEAVEFWHVGGVYTRFSQGKIYPFTSFTLGATRFINESGPGDDVWKFSIILGLGAKVHVNDRLGIRAQARMPWTFVNTGVGLGFGTGGASVGVGGSGIVGFDVSGGLFLMI
jgi:hypothetical protein